MMAFKGALDCGADGAELDVHLTADGEVVVYHDEALKPEITRGADGAFLENTGPLIKTLTYAELQTYDVGRLKPGTRYAASHPAQQGADRQRIPHLIDVIRLIQARSSTFMLWIEMKTDLMRPERSADPVILADAVHRIVREAMFQKQAVYISFDWRCLKRTKELDPTIPTMATTLPQSWFETENPPKSHWPPPSDELAAMRECVRRGAPWQAGYPQFSYPSLQHAVQALGADGWFPFYPDITEESAVRTRNLGLSLAAWTVPAAASSGLSAYGCRAICTDDPVAVRHNIPKSDNFTS